MSKNGSWITCEILEEVLSNHENEKIKVVDKEVVPAVGIGDNYLSDIYRVTVGFERSDGKVERRQLIIKKEPSVEYLKTLTREHQIFRKELYMYNVCLPKMKKVLAEHFPEDGPFLAPEAYKCDLDNVIVLEDLQETGYKMTEKKVQLDLAHSIVALRTLAKFHALSVKVKEMEPKVFCSVSTNFYDEMDKGMLEANAKTTYPLWIETLEEWPGTKPFAPVLTRLCENAYEKTMAVLNDDSDSLKVLNHGDPWMNNVMFAKDDGNALRAKFVDYQITKYGSPVIDLIYFLFTSIQPEVLDENLFHFIDLYHESLSFYLTKLGVSSSEKVSYEQLERHFYRHKFFIIVVLATVMPMIVAKPENVVDFENVKLEDFMNADRNPLESQWKATNYRKLLEKYLAILNKYGLLTENSSGNG